MRALVPIGVAVALAACAPASPPAARAGLAAKAAGARGALPSLAAAATTPARRTVAAPVVAGDVITDVRDVRACLPLQGGAVLAATGGGLLLVRADGSTRAPWTALDGLPETRVHALLRDGERVWLGTEGGLAAARLHGEALTVERILPGKPVRALALHDGDLFAATWGGGVVRVDVARGELVPVGAAPRVTEARFGALAEHEGALYAGAPTGLYRVVDGKVAPVAGAPASVWALAPREGRFWVGGTRGLMSLAGGAFRGESDADVRALATGEDEVLVGSFGQGALELRAGHASARAAEWPSEVAFVQAVGASGGVRCAGGPEGLYVQRGAGEAWEAVHGLDLASNDVTALARDGERLWIGTFDRGLSVLDGDRLTRVRDAAIDDKINGLAVEHGASVGRVWVATARGLDRVEGAPGALRVTRYGDLDGLPSSDVHAVAALSTGGVLVGTAHGAAIVRDGHVTALSEKRGIPAGAVWAVAEGPDGALLLGTTRGLLVGDREGLNVTFRGAPAQAGGGEPSARPWVQMAMATGDLEDDWVTAIAVLGRTVYVGTYNAGVTMLTMGDAGAVTAEHLGGGYVNMGALLVEGGMLYAGTMNGLLVRSADGAGEWETARRAAPGKDVTAIVGGGGGGGGRLWVASRRGLARFAPAMRGRPRSGARGAHASR